VSLEPSPSQLAALRDGDPAERLALVRLLRVSDRAAYTRFRDSLDAAVRAAGGHCSYEGVVDAVLMTDSFSADALRIDEFPSRELAAESLRLANPHRDAALAEALVLAARPRRIPRLALRARGLWLRLRAGRKPPARGAMLPDSGNRAIDPVPDELAAFLAKRPERPLFVLNLNQHRDPAAYGRYGSNALPELLCRRVKPVFWGEGGSDPAGALSHAGGHARYAERPELSTRAAAARAGPLARQPGGELSRARLNDQRAAR
jgi:hypothetical protein